jgi:DNA polymerase
MSEDARAELGRITAALRAYLEWQQDAGTVGFPRGEGAFARPLGPGVPVSAQAPAPVPAQAPVRASAPALASAQAPAPVPALAPAAPAVDRHVRLPELAAEVSTCTKCGLAATRTQTVFSRGNPDAALCFVGEAPGADEDAQGLPFVGRAGQLLDKMIAAMGLSPERDVYICNILKCRPPGNRRPEPEEMATCIPYLHEQLALVKPKVIVAMGNTAVAALLETKLGITKLRGQFKLYRGHTLVMPTYHPSYLLRPSPQQTEAKREAWQDLQLVMKELGMEAPR